jgi:ACS family tartrate transporter-like MFS transporter
VGGSEVTESGEELRRRVVSKVTRRLVSFLFVCYVIAYLDRVNISFAGGLKSDLHLDNTEFGWGKGLFFLGYFLFEIPSNLILHRVGARIWIARIMIVWGLVSMAMVFVVGKWSFYGMRVLLGLAEAGFFPGVVLYLTYWVPSRERARMGALFMVAAPVAMAFGGPVSGLLTEIHGVAGVKGWQWLFLAEGLPAVLLGILALKFLVSRPEQATWLTEDERRWLSDELARERALKPAQDHAPLRESLLNPKVWVLCLFYFLNTTVTYGIFLWLGEILESVSGFKNFKLGLLSGATLLPAIAGMILITAHSDRTGERRWHTAVCAVIAALGLVLTTLAGHNVLGVALSLALCHVGQRTVQGVFWSIPPVFLGGTAAAAGIAFINAVGNLGGQVGPSLMGWLKDRTDGYNRGLLVLAAALVLEAGVVLCIRMPARVKVA